MCAWGGGGGALCALYAPSMCPLCAHYAPSMRPLCALYAPSMRPLCALYAPSMRPLCALYAPSMRPLYALYAPSIRPLCALYGPSMRPLCAHDAPSMWGDARGLYRPTTRQRLRLWWPAHETPMSDLRVKTNCGGDTQPPLHGFLTEGSHALRQGVDSCLFHWQCTPKQMPLPCGACGTAIGTNQLID